MQPRKFQYKNKQKRRICRQFCSVKPLLFGNFGLLLLTSFLITSKRFSRFQLALKRSLKKSDKTYRYFWFKFFPHLPLSRKIVGARMGKGKGKLKTWCSTITPGTIFIEFFNLRIGKFLKLKKKCQLKIHLNIAPIRANHATAVLPFLNKQTPLRVLY